MSRDGDVASFRHRWAKQPDDDPASLRASIDRHPSTSGSRTLDAPVGWAKVMQDATETDSIRRLDDSRPQPDTVATLGKLIVGIAGGDKDRQQAIATELMGVVARPLHEFVERHVDRSNAADFLHALECIVEEKLQQDNDKQGE